ncbi:MAG: hypothetical protein JNM17_07720 [Archangium sp.]|nr:hypothetical protein [Archangium sp.]
MNLCVIPERDAGEMTRDSGTQTTPDASVEIDAGQTDAGASDAGLSDAGLSDAGLSDAGASDAGTETDAGTCVPSIEVCNGVDDDCDGLVDDMAAVSALDAGVIELDGGFALANGMCTLGIGACSNTGVTSCAAGALSCNALPGMPGVERCNTIDDDCDGMTDENDPGICSVTGQICTGGSCACPSGQSVCNGMCKVLTAEICDGLDNDCNGQTDEGVTITCLADGDNDTYANDSVNTQQCADPSRSAFGNCPSGFVAPTQSPAIDCNATDATKFRSVTSRNDSDNDTYCAGTAAADCVGASALPGRRFATDCNPSNDDCDDARLDRYRFVASKGDQDGDAYCAGTDTMDCVGQSALPGRRFSSACQPNADCNDSQASLFQYLWVRRDVDSDFYCSSMAAEWECSGATPNAGRRLDSACINSTDCNDNNASLFRLAVTAPDADNDTYCTTTGASQCIGTNPPAGFRMANTCNVANLDCNDANASLVRNVSLRTDSDNDSWCSGSAYTACIGPGAAPAGTRFAANCAGDDCRDSNPYAGGTCTMPNAFTTAYHTHLGVHPAGNFTVNTVTACPTGFSVSGWFAERASNSLNGFCSATGSPNVIAQSANGLDGSTCRIVGNCVAN